ncbi:DHA2 family efflux MFS transporter permease subunit [Nonomuraea insulae]|uniref:DHA2 family efflux MFS transporter permease subunit n=1 Tax=Nonomuraea insulae TaxID=1616787 RepID=A0ABW1CRK6_9ACTN
MSVPKQAPGWAVLTLLCLGQLMVVLDVSIVNVALPAIRADLGFTEVGLQWVVNSYALTYCGFLLLGGRAADLFGRRRVFVAGLALFTLASLAGAVAQDPTVLVVARSVQGLGGAILSPATLTLVTTIFTGAARPRAMAAWTAVAGGGAALGSVLGGVLTGLIDWRWILWVNVPIGVLAIVAAYMVLPESRAEGERPRLDVLGSLLVTVGLIALAYGIVNTTGEGWGAIGTLVPLIGGAVLLAWFLFHEERVAREPLMPLRFFRTRSVTVANLTMFWLGCAVIAHFYFLSLYMQNVLHYGPLAAGLGFLPGAAVMTIGAYSGPALMKRFGLRPLAIFGPVLVVAGLVWLSFIPVQGSFVTHLLVPMMLVTFGTGVAMMPINFAAMTGIAPQEAGLASGMINTTRQVGGAVGLAVLATIAATRTGASAQTMVDGYGLAFLIGGGFAVLAVLTSLAMPKTAGLPAAPPPQPAESTDASPSPA